ncbi:hypothetical protein [Maridesulfovibrio zosterae]|uniref:hypothetical protein n=1 Tax=Maridesulfovibrio zosterae TaxID=82171 RepID=UPI00040650B0|nr:hypothetical protein [Maridesulfovibrio zosterae]
MIKKSILLMCFFFIFTAVANAQSPLTGSEIERVLDTLQALEPYSDQMDAEREKNGEFDSDVLDPEMFNRECALIYGYNSQTKRIIEANGFTYKTWPEAAGRVMKAMAFLSMQEEGQSGAEEMQKALTQIDADQSMTPEQKKMMKQHIQSTFNTAEIMMKAPKEDVDAVRPYYEILSE